MNPNDPSIAVELPTVAVPSKFRQFYSLTKPRVVQLIVFCALIGMVLAVPGVPNWAEVKLGLIACAGIWLVAGAAAAFNCLVEQGIDARMKRTSWRATAQGQISNLLTLAFSAGLCALGSAILYIWVNPLTMWLTFATFVGYAVVYTVVLKPLTPQNIVIGGASGAMPPVLGWAAMTGRSQPGGADTFPDHLFVDASALLGASALPGRRLPQGRPAHAARHARQRVHAAAGFSVHAGAAACLPDAFCFQHERLALPCSRPGAKRWFLLVWLAAVAQLF